MAKKGTGSGKGVVKEDHAVSVGKEGDGNASTEISGASDPDRETVEIDLPKHVIAYFEALGDDPIERVASVLTEYVRQRQERAGVQIVEESAKPLGPDENIGSVPPEGTEGAEGKGEGSSEPAPTEGSDGNTSPETPAA